MLQGKSILTPIQRHCLEIFVHLPDQEQFYLTGGTALAEFYLAHRLSFDLDFFTDKEQLILPFSHALEQAYSKRGWQVSVTQRFATFVAFLLLREGEEDPLKIDLALDSAFKLTPPVQSAFGVRINAYKDLIVEKMLAYYGRAEPRDAVDLYFILQRESMEELLALAAQKDPGFDLYWFAVALNHAADFPEDLERWPVMMRVNFDPVELKQSFQAMAFEIMDRISPQ